MEKVNPAWLALLFAQLCCGIKHMTREQLGRVGPYGVTEGSSSFSSLFFFRLPPSPLHYHLLLPRLTCSSPTDEARPLAKSYLDAALASLYSSHFLENGQLYSVQAIAVLVVSCQDGAFSNLFPALLSLGVSLALELGLHRLPSEEAWAASVAGQSLEQRAVSICAYESKKRIFWALTAQDWCVLFSSSPLLPSFLCFSPPLFPFS
jgi:hypothetical protein